MTGADLDLVGAVRGQLAAAADPLRAPAMQAYMKSALPYLGAAMPVVRRTVRPLFTARPLPDRAAWEATILSLWDGATHREERYAALELARHRHYRAYQDPASVAGLYRRLIVTGAWWDLVDTVSPQLVGPILVRCPDESERMRAWADADDLWLRRAAILSQLAAKQHTNTVLLADVIDANAVGTPHGHEFFVRKAIGWALRQYAATDASWVRTFLDERGHRLTPLSVREASKHLA